MSLTSRVSVFFLGVLAFALAGSGFTVYGLTANHFALRADERLEAALETLCGSAELSRHGVEWEPNTRNLSLGQDVGDDAVRWIVQDGGGKFVARSSNLGDADLADSSRWHSQSRQVTAPWFEETTSRHPVSLRTGYFDRLVLTAAVSPHPGRAELTRLAQTLTAVGTVTWLLAALVGRRLCRRALTPVRNMAAAAATMNASDLGHRLDPAGTGDELEDLGSAFNGLLGRLEEAFERQRRFAGDAAHQLSTPLTVLLGQLEVALLRDRSAPEYRTAIVEAHSQAVNLRQIVELLLFLSRPEADASPPRTERVDLQQWLPEHLALWKAHPRAGDIRLNVTADRAMPVTVAPAMLGQLLDTLLDNSCKYSAPGTLVTVRLQLSNDGVVIRVDDAGIGIASDELAHVFEPFFRSPEARRLGKPGVGLGLAVARRIATALGGTLTADSTVGRGSRFELRLPASRA
jgi:heavy metal sensor kinase